jgi:hypothetical protein
LARGSPGLPAALVCATLSRRRWKAYDPTASTSTASRKAGDSRKLKSVPVKSTPLSSRASAPASSAGRNGRTPLAPESPAPWPMSVKRVIPGVLDQYAAEGG